MRHILQLRQNSPKSRQPQPSHTFTDQYQSQIPYKIRDSIFELSFILLISVKNAALISGGCFTAVILHALFYEMEKNYTQTWLLSPWFVSTRHFENLFSVTISNFFSCLVSTEKFVYKRVARFA
jgi:hypothetical protein